MAVADEPIRREREIGIASAAQARVAAGGRELVLVEGDLGSGKSGVLDALDGVHVLRGACDDVDRATAFGALLAGLRVLVHRILTESDVKLAQWRNELRAGLADTAGALVAEVPELEHVIGKPAAVAPLAPLQAHARLRLALEAFVDVACQPGRPLAIVLDDLHKADDATLGFVGDLAIDDARAHLMIARSYRADARGPLLPLFQRLDTHIAPVWIVLGPLAADELARDFARRFGVDDASDLADVVMAKTGGSPFAVREFLRAMVDAGAISYRRGWEWDLARLAAANVTDDIAGLIGAQLAQLPGATRRVIATAACIGERFAVAELARLADQAPADLMYDLDDAVRAGIVTHAGGGFRFVHDRIRDAARALLDRPAQDRIHVRLARRLAEANRDKHLLDIADHLNAAAGSLDDQAERGAANAEAGRRARGSGAYASARHYLRAAIDASGGTLALLSECAEAELLAGDPDSADALLELAFAHAATDLERVAVYRQRLWQDTSRGLGARAIESGTRALELLGIHPETGEDALRARLARVEALLAGVAIAELHEAEDPRVRAAMDVLDALQPSTYNFAQPLCAFVTLELVELSLRHGNTPASVAGYGGMFLVLWQLRGDAAAFRTAAELGRVSVQLAERYGNDSQRSRAMIRLGACITAWVAPAQHTLAILDDGYRIGLAAGELSGAGLNLQYRALNAHFTGTNLEQLGGELDRDLRFARKSGLELVAAMLVGLRNVTHALAGGDAPDAEARFLASYGKWPAHAAVHDIFAAEARFVLGDPAGALARCDRARERLGDVGALLVNATLAVTHSLALAQLYPTSPEARADADRRIADNQARLASWSASCPDNFEHLHLVVEAERARLRGDRLAAIDAYDAAIARAARSGFNQHEAIACELAGRFWHAQGRDHLAATYMRRALTAYRRWGATRAVQRIVGAYATMLDEPVATNAQLGSVLEASQAISQEVELDALIARILGIVIDHTGAGHGAVVVKEETGLVVYTRGAPAVLLEATRDVPASVVRYVLRTGKPVSIDDAPTDAAFGRDPGVAARGARSLLAVAMTARGTVRGVIYLDHPSRRAFGADRAHLVEVLASQAAISLDNAVAYRSLWASNRELERALEQVEETARLRKELEIGARIQTSILPAELVVPGLDIAAQMLTASEVGGDYYDVLPTSFGAWIGIGDVAGHGLNAGLVMLMAQSAIAALTRQRPDARPSEIVTATNALLYENIRRRMHRDEHVTLSLLRYRADGHITFAGAHEDILVARARGGCEWIPTPGAWVGAREDVRPMTVDGELRLEPDDVMVLYTDGVIEAMNAHRQELGSNRLAEIVAAHQRDPVEALRDRIVGEVERWSPERRDDVTVLVARQRLPRAS